MTGANPIRYVRTHWAGEQGFGWSFWVNLVALRLAISIGQGVLTPADPVDVSGNKTILLAVGVFAHGVVLIWQVVGVLRASEAHIRALGSMTNSWGAILGVLVVFWLALSDMWGVWIVTLPLPPVDNFAERMAREHASRYDLLVDGHTLTFDGEIDLGATKAVQAMLVENPGVMVLDLDSPGGNIYEARGLAKLAQSHGLATQVTGSCTSSCTVAFIGGTQRQVLYGARLGFHQYKISADYQVPLADPAREQARDLELFRQAGVASWFLDVMFQERAEGMWFPGRDKLRAAGVVTAP